MGLSNLYYCEGGQLKVSMRQGNREEKGESEEGFFMIIMWSQFIWGFDITML